MKHASLFSGIGGFDLAAKWMAWENVFQVEKDEFCQKVLLKNFPETERYGDIYEFDGKKYKGEIDIITGGFPCQPFSTAGKRKGESDDRYLWPEMLRVIREVQPNWIVGENVAGILSMDDGRTFERICADLEGEGYSVQAFNIPASSVEAIHQRQRIWIVGYSESNHKRRNRIQKGKSKIKAGRPGGIITSNSILSDGGKVQLSERTTELRSEFEQHGETGNAYNPHHEQREFSSRADERKLLRQTVSPVRRANDGLPPELDRRKRLKALGNAIVPQVAFEIFCAIQSYS